MGERTDPPRLDAAYFREREAELRMLAATFRDPVAKLNMIRLADVYRRLATKAEQLAKYKRT